MLEGAVEAGAAAWQKNGGLGLGVIMRTFRLLARHTAHHAPMILVAIFVLLVMTATSACKRGPVLDMRTGARVQARAPAGWSAF